MKNDKIKIIVRRLIDGDYTLESIRGAAKIQLQYPPPCSSRTWEYHVGDTIRQEEADAMALEYDLTALAPK